MSRVSDWSIWHKDGVLYIWNKIDLVYTCDQLGERRIGEGEFPSLANALSIPAAVASFDKKSDV